MAANAWQMLSENQQRTAITIMEPAAGIGMEYQGHVNPGTFDTGIGTAITGQNISIDPTQQIGFN